jgi:hypothetical protein
MVKGTVMTTLGKNVKITAPESIRPAARTLFETLGASLASPSAQMDVFALGDRTNVGFAYVPDEQALTPAQMRIAPWLELAVPDVERARGQLAELGLEQIEYVDNTHPYFIGPGGFVFRLAAGA